MYPYDYSLFFSCLVYAISKFVISYLPSKSYPYQVTGSFYKHITDSTHDLMSSL